MSDVSTNDVRGQKIAEWARSNPCSTLQEIGLIRPTVGTDHLGTKPPQGTEVSE